MVDTVQEDMEVLQTTGQLDSFAVRAYCCSVYRVLERSDVFVWLHIVRSNDVLVLVSQENKAHLILVSHN